MVTKVANWLNDRLGWRTVWTTIFARPVPKVNWFYTLGSAALDAISKGGGHQTMPAWGSLLNPDQLDALAASPLAQRMLGTQTTGGVMPPGGALSKGKVQIITDWIAAGTPDN